MRRQNSTSCELILFLYVSLLTWVLNLQFCFLLMFVCLFVSFWRYFSRQVCDLEEKIVHSVQDTLKLIELGNKLR